MDPKVSIVAVNWNKSNDIVSLMDSLLTIDYKNFEVFIIDNASTDDSVEKIRKHKLNVNLKINEKNLGGTGGFNSGIRFALNSTNCKYVWLLDNDATVSPGALRHLVEALESDNEIGLAGSRIVNAENQKYVVETGAMFAWKNGAVKPVDRNMPLDQTASSGMIDVDYVAVCSAMARVSALVDVGLMDERYFLFWDDMDWGIAFKESGFRVVAVPESIIYHRAFTEYRNVVVDSYYGVRNQLLAFSKYRHVNGAKAGIWNYARRFGKGVLLLLLTKRQGGKVALFGLKDFFVGKWGKISYQVPEEKKIVIGREIKLKPSSKVLVVPGQGVGIAKEVVDYLWSEGVQEVDFLVAKDRVELFADLRVSNFVTIDYDQKNISLLSFRVFLNVAFGRYLTTVKTDPKSISPFSYAVNQSALFDSGVGLVKTFEALPQVWKIIIAALVGELWGAFIFIGIWVRGYFIDRR